jgi:hypothetical protein
MKSTVQPIAQLVHNLRNFNAEIDTRRGCHCLELTMLSKSKPTQTVLEIAGRAAIAGAIALGVAFPSPVEAATITYDFQVNVTSGVYQGQQFSGYFSYDDSLPSPVTGTAMLPRFDVSEFVFNFGGITYRKPDLFYDPTQGLLALPLQITGGAVVTGANGESRATAQGGTLRGFGFTTYDRTQGAQDFFVLTSTNNLFYGVYTTPGDPTSASNGDGTLTYAQRIVRPVPDPVDPIDPIDPINPGTDPAAAAVPEPSTLLGVLGSMGLGWWMKKGRRVGG